VNKIILEKSDFVDEIVVGNLLVWLGIVFELDPLDIIAMEALCFVWIEKYIVRRRELHVLAILYYLMLVCNMVGPLREAARMGVKQALRSIDAFPRAEDHLLQKTQSGAVGNGFFFLFALLVILESPYVCLNMLTF